MFAAFATSVAWLATVSIT